MKCAHFAQLNNLLKLIEPDIPYWADEIAKPRSDMN